ncbi:GTPase [Rhodococcus sp. NPDC058505]|uniref:GTPase n=1 Tax=Rhodococcus sp. NPDC058505 TaxID=3346531 RepID=UPI003664A125
MTRAGHDPVHAVVDDGLRRLAALGGDLADHANGLGAILWSPPRVVIVGRLKAGKSTLVNALIGAPVAETAALEATKVVTIYQDGAPSRAEVVGLDGVRRPVAVSPGAEMALPIPAAEVGHVHRWLPSAAIRDVTLIDTPGLATLTTPNEAATRRALIDGVDQTRTASVDADAAVFLFDATPRADELEFLRTLPFTPLNVLGVLSRADGFGEGALGQQDPLVLARSHAAELGRRLARTATAVTPISGLMAQTAYTGALTERDAQLLAGLAPYHPLDLVDLLDSDDPAPLTPADRDRLLDLLGEYGILHGRGVARSGAAALGAWLAERSGVEDLRRLMHASIGRVAVWHRAGRILDRLDRLAYQHPARDQIRTIAHQMRSAPALRQVTLLEDLARLLQVDPESPLVDEVRDLLAGDTACGRLGLAADADPALIRATAQQRLADAQQRAAFSTQSAAEDTALVTVIAAYQDMLSAR